MSRLLTFIDKRDLKEWKKMVERQLAEKVSCHFFVRNE